MKITSDHSGFAGVRSTAMQHPPENIRSPELSNLAQGCFPGSNFLAGADFFLLWTTASPEFGHS